VKMLLLYLIAPKGYEQLSSVVAAPDEEIARQKAYSNPAIQELVDMGAELISVNITSGLATQGYSVEVFKSGMFH
jgi:hypothetical protein